jgi:pyridoxal phosphate enzyme (YggS family)
MPPFFFFVFKSITNSPMDISTNLTFVRQKLDEAIQKAGRKLSDVRLIAVSKFHDRDAVKVALQAGQRLFGENRVQEARDKFPPLRESYPDIELHLIGPLQTNKAADAVRLFDVIETLDRPALAEALAKAMTKLDRHVPCYIEINIGKEPQKAGIAPEALADFLKLCRDTYSLTVTGLMCIPPEGRDPRPYFVQVRQLAEQHQLSHISMGMSADYEIAIAERATEVRIGTAIFGERPKL